MKLKRKIKSNKTSNFTPIISILLIGIIICVSMFYEKSWGYDWSSIRKEIKDSIRVYKFTDITSGIAGDGISSINEVKRRGYIMKNATINELNKLTQFPNGNIKAIAYEGLLRNNNFKNKFNIIIKAINDNDHMVYYQSGCIGQEISIGEYLIQNVLDIDDRLPPRLPNYLSNNFSINDLEKQKILVEFRKNKKVTQE
ncbi:hypothetical protein [Tenacibaculum aquimarinum]|uniref:hypothetical protein n=1 Tax=Tenacibaculum aquimarinum TaxID=2910675 RepID=UPI001F0B0942|nr:hypothetical protein [Tenacibaculum aquimarinum]MCH3884872.1 hypothetical protein [Tenacibaculum aquimarinum]